MSKAKIKQLKEDIADYKAVLASASAQQDEKDFAKEMLAEAEAELEKLEAEEEGEKEEKPKAKPEKEAKPAKERKPREKKAKAPRPEKKEAPKKKKDEPSCDDLLKAWQERRTAAKKAAKKAKTRSVMAMIADKVEDAVAKAIKTVPVSDIKKDPKRAINRFEKLETSMQEFLQDFRTVLGDEYKAAEVTSAVKHIEDLIKKLKARYDK